jgi:carboxylate-amine ligase
MLEERPKARRQLVCGVHVHVGMPSFGHCLATLESILPWLPAVLALSLNSPYLRPTAPGVLSGRAGRLLELPRAGLPPPLPDRESWERVVAPIGDYTRIWWDLRPHPRLGTLEIRIADQQTAVHRSAALAALLQALCVAAEPPATPSDRDDYLQWRELAARGVAPAEELLRVVEPASRELGTWELVELLRERPEAYRQLEVGESAGLQAVAADLVARSAE